MHIYVDIIFSTAERLTRLYTPTL